jgi:hypothetical protein
VQWLLLLSVRFKHVFCYSVSSAVQPQLLSNRIADSEPAIGVMFILNHLGLCCPHSTSALAAALALARSTASRCCVFSSVFTC